MSTYFAACQPTSLQNHLCQGSISSSSSSSSFVKALVEQVGAAKHLLKFKLFALACCNTWCAAKDYGVYGVLQSTFMLRSIVLQEMLIVLCTDCCLAQYLLNKLKEEVKETLHDVIHMQTDKTKRLTEQTNRAEPYQVEPNK